MRTFLFKTYRRTKPEGTCGELMKVTEFEAPHLAAAIRIAEEKHLQGLDFRYDFAILADDDDHPFVNLWLSDPRV